MAMKAARIFSGFYRSSVRERERERSSSPSLVDPI